MIHHDPKKQTQIVTKMIKHVGSFGRAEPRQGAFIPSRGQSDFVCSICLNIHQCDAATICPWMSSKVILWNVQSGSSSIDQFATPLQWPISHLHMNSAQIPGRQHAYFCRVSYQPPLQCCRATGYAPCSSNSKTFCNLRSSSANAKQLLQRNPQAGLDWTPQ